MSPPVGALSVGTQLMIVCDPPVVTVVAPGPGGEMVALPLTTVPVPATCASAGPP